MTRIPLEDQPIGITVGDFVGDGSPDIVVGQRAGRAVSILEGDGAGGFSLRTTIPVEGLVFEVRVGAGDVNGDGQLEILVSEQRLSVLTRGDGDTFSIERLMLINLPAGVVAHDMDLDGTGDLVCTTPAFDSLRIAYRQADGSISRVDAIPLDGSPVSVAVDDWNGDGRPDLSIGLGESGGIQFLVQTPDGSFDEAARVDVPFHGVTSIAVADLDGNGTLDHVAARDEANEVAIVFGRIAPGTPPCVGDVDGSGTVDTIDLLTVLSNWGACDDACPSDLDEDGLVGMTDLVLLVSRWGPCVDS